MILLILTTIIIIIILLLGSRLLPCNKCSENYCVEPKTICTGAEPRLTCAEWNMCECNRPKLTGGPDPISGYYWKHPKRSYFGYNMKFYPDLKDDHYALASICNDTPGCVGFETSGNLKSYIRNPTEWSVAPTDIYVKQQVEQRI